MLRSRPDARAQREETDMTMIVKTAKRVLGMGLVALTATAGVTLAGSASADALTEYPEWVTFDRTSCAETNPNTTCTYAGGDWGLGSASMGVSCYLGSAVQRP